MLVVETIPCSKLGFHSQGGLWVDVIGLLKSLGGVIEFFLLEIAPAEARIAIEREEIIRLVFQRAFVVMHRVGIKLQLVSRFGGAPVGTGFQISFRFIR